MNQEQLKRMQEGKGFIAALDQSGGSTPKALKAYGVQDGAYSNDEEMFNLVHEMRTRIVTAPCFNSEHVLAAILFEMTMDREVKGKKTGAYLWEEKGIVPFVKVDEGLAPESDGVQLMKPMKKLDDLLDRAVKNQIFGTKMRSVINSFNEQGIRAIVEQQFEIAKKICEKGLVPIIEPEVNIKSADKKECEQLLHDLLKEYLAKLPEQYKVMLKLSIPTVAGLYDDLAGDSHLVRIVALSGGYSRDEANKLLKKNHKMIASFSRALAEELRLQMTDEEFDAELKNAVVSIYDASVNKE